jgi:uncharacterized phage-associated protein
MKNKPEKIESTSSNYNPDTNPEFYPVNSENVIQINDASWSSAGTDDESRYSIWSRKLQDTKMGSKVTVFDVASYVLGKLGSMSTMRLQKLVYYCQVWSLVWDEEPLFLEDIEAWANGPVIKELFNYHRGHYSISEVTIGNPDTMSSNQKATIDAVLEYYGDKSAQWLIDLSHMEDPWKKARTEMNDFERGNRVISLESLSEYYSSLQ